MATYTHILIPTDGSPLALVGARQAVTLAKDLNAKLTALHVSAPWTPPYSESSAVIASFEQSKRAYENETQAKARKALDDVQSLARDARVACDNVTLVDTQPWESIIRTAETQRCDLIVMGSHGRGTLGTMLLGSQALQVLSHSKIPVLVCR